MGYRTLQSCIADLRRTGRLVEWSEPVDPYLEMAAVQRRLYRERSPAVLFLRPVDTGFPMLANLYGTEERLEYIFRDGIDLLRRAVDLGADPLSFVFRSGSRSPTFPLLRSALAAFRYSRPCRVSTRRAPVLSCLTTVDRLPRLVGWPDDGGPYITLPLVYTEDPACPGFGRSNLGMYRVQLSGNDYFANREVGLHYQIQRGIAGHHAAALEAGRPLRVNVFVGGAPAMTLAAVMPMPEGTSELLFAGILGRHRIPMAVDSRDVFLPIYAEADFCLSGTLFREQKKEGPFGDHLGYYSLGHEFPVLRVESVHHRRDAVWPFTTVGRPPQEDTQFGRFIHRITGDAVTKKIPGVRSVHAVDEAGVHPLLLAIGREQYLPLDPTRRSAELHTLAHAILGFGQLSLAKYLLLAAEGDDPRLETRDVRRFFRHLLRRIDFRRDIHFTTRTTADTLDYSGYSRGELGRGSKVFMSVSGPPIRELADSPDPSMPVGNPHTALPGILCVEQIDWIGADPRRFPDEFPLIVLADDSEETASDWRNFLWTTFTKSDPATDIHGIGEFLEDKHWGCTGPLVIDARRKPHHAPELVEPPEIADRADRIVDRILASCRDRRPNPLSFGAGSSGPAVR